MALIIESDGLKLRDASIEAFVRANADDGRVLQTLVEGFQLQCRTLQHCMAAVADPNSVDRTIGERLKAFEQRERARLDEMESRIVGKVAGVLSGVDTCAITDKVTTSVAAMQAKTLQDTAVLRSDMTDLKRKMEVVDGKVTYNTTSHQKGKVGEARMFDLLCDALEKDPWSVSNVSETTHSCDILVSHAYKPSVLVEVKNYAGRVGTDEVNKFRKDLMERNEHGVFVSLNSAISNIGAMHFERLPNRKFAIYLANVEYEVKKVTDMIQHIHALDAAFPHEKEGDVACELTAEKIKNINTQVLLFDSQIRTIKKRMEESIHMDQATVKLLDKMRMDAFINIIGADKFESVLSREAQLPPLKTNDKKRFDTCPYCGKFQEWSSQSFSNHKNRDCPNKPLPEEGEEKGKKRKIIDQDYKRQLKIDMRKQAAAILAQEKMGNIEAA